MTPSPDEAEALRLAEDEASKQKPQIEPGVDPDLFAGLGDVVSAVGNLAEGAAELVGGVLGGIGSVLEGF